MILQLIFYNDALLNVFMKSSGAISGIINYAKFYYTKNTMQKHNL